MRTMKDIEVVLMLMVAVPTFITGGALFGMLLIFNFMK